MRSESTCFSVAIILFLSACSAPTAATNPASPPANPIVAPTPAETADRRQGAGIIVLSLGGAQADLIEQYMADGLMPNLAGLVKDGVKAQYAQSVDPPLIAPVYASISSGCFPSKTGVIADKYHRPQDDFTQYISSLDEPEMAVEPVWRTAMRHGLRTAAVFWPGADLPKQSADYTVAYGESYAPSAQHTITFTVASGWENAGI